MTCLRERVLCLTTTGGCGGRPSELDGDWFFDYSDVQPQTCAVTPYVNEISSNANDTDCRSGTTFSSESSCDVDDNFFDYSEVESIGSFVTLRVIELHSPLLVINWLIFLPYHLQ